MMTIFDQMPPQPVFNPDEFGPTERKAVGKIQRLTAGFLHRNWVSIPHVTHNDEIDVTEIERKRQDFNRENSGQRLSPLMPLIKALCATLQANPTFNASLDQDGAHLFFKRYFHVGVAVDTPNGLLVAVIRDCDKKSMGEISEEVATMSDKARTKGLSLADMSGGCMTISSLGHIGGTSFSPIINAPEVAILGVTKLIERPVRGADDAIEWRKHLPVSLSYDHRVINGADAARFVVSLGEHLNAIDFSA